MVKYADVVSSNTSFLSSPAASDLTAVFVGATAGIGLGALKAFLKHTRESKTSPTIYILGRQQQSIVQLIDDIQPLNPEATLVPIESGDLSLVRSAEAAAQKILAQADKVDLLIMSPGYLSLKRDESPEGLDRVQAVRFYSRMRILVTLTPLLQASPNPRVVSVLGAGTEGNLYPDDWLLKKNYSLPAAAGAAGSMMGLFLEEYSQQKGNERISLVHSFPGLVSGTGLRFNGIPAVVKFATGWIAQLGVKIMGYSIEEAGERVLYAATSPKFPAKGGKDAEKSSDGSIGSGVYLVGDKSEALVGGKLMIELREKGLRKGVWEHTQRAFEGIAKDGRVDE